MAQAKKQFFSGFTGVTVFVTLCLVFYLYAKEQKDRSYQEMTARLNALEIEKSMAMAQQEELILQIQSQADPAYVEMVLKKNLGLVPNDQTKVYFSPSK